MDDVYAGKHASYGRPGMGSLRGCLHPLPQRREHVRFCGLRRFLHECLHECLRAVFELLPSLLNGLHGLVFELCDARLQHGPLGRLHGRSVVDVPRDILQQVCGRVGLRDKWLEQERARQKAAGCLAEAKTIATM